MYRITFKGTLEPAYVPDGVGKILYEKWLDDALDPKIEIENGRAILSNTIRAIEGGHSLPGVSGEKLQANTIENNETEEDYIGKRFSLANKPAEEKAKNLHIATLVWWSYTGQRNIPEEMKPQIEQRQLKFFKGNKRHAYANPICYKDLIPLDEGKRPVIEGRENIKRIDALARGRSATEFVERVLQKDNYYAHRL